MYADLLTKTLVIDPLFTDIRSEALRAEVFTALDGILAYIPTISNDILPTVHAIKNPGLLADFIAPQHIGASRGQAG